MAASAPAANILSWNDDSAANALEIGMSGMSLISNNSDGTGRKETGSTVSSSSPTDDDFVSTQLPSTADINDERKSDRGSPSLDRQRPTALIETAPVEATVVVRNSRPPGLVGALGPSSKPGHSKNNSCSSSMITLTPSSSIDGHADWPNVVRQASPFHGNEVPPMPYLSSEHRAGGPADEGSRGGTLEVSDHGNDGLLGLEALRERSHSSPGPPSQTNGLSPRGHLPAPGFGHLEHAPERSTRPGSRDRPPLSASYGDSHSAHGDRSVGGISLPFSNRGNDHSVGVESVESRGFGVIGRPELWQGGSDYETSSRHRVSTSDNHPNPYSLPPQEAVTQKFGTLQSLGVHMQSQRSHDGYGGDLPKPRHVRSVSQPVMANQGSSHYGAESRYQQGVHPPPGPVGDPTFKTSVPRSASISQSSFPSYETGSLSVNGHNGYSYGYQTLHRRESLDFHIPHVSSGGSVGGSDDFRYGGGMITPGQSPLQVHYASHSRQGSDATSALLSSSPLSSQSGFHRSIARVHNPGGEEDHPLVGEHIEVPADHDDYGLPSTYIIGPGSHPRFPHGHSASLDQLPAHYERHLPTAGAALPLPKVVYSVKFKRTQRNFVLGPRINRDLKIGTYVKVEADRGEDLGIVVGKVPAEKYNFSGRASFTAGMGPPAGLGASGAADLKRIIRLATHDEVSLLTMKREEEEELLKICRGKVRQRGLPMNVVDAEYQFDRHKLTFFFEAEGRVDFRELVRDLFSMYKTRIWMQQLDKNTSTSAQAIVSPQTASLQMDFGTPIIAPASEFADSIVLGSISGGDVRSH